MMPNTAGVAAAGDVWTPAEETGPETCSQKFWHKKLSAHQGRNSCRESALHAVVKRALIMRHMGSSLSSVHVYVPK